MKVLKFGGSSVGTPERIRSVIEIISTALKNDQVAVVVSAFEKVTDSLIKLGTLASTGREEYLTELKALEEKHLEAARELIPINRQSAILAQIKVMVNELRDILHGISLVKEITQRTLDSIMSFGERLSCYIIAETFKAKGITCEYVDSRSLVKTDDTFGVAKVNFDSTYRLIADYFRKLKALPIITGFIGSTEKGETTTLGRGGSDYMASIIAGGISASSIEIWTDVDGMMTADPRKVPNAFPIEALTYEEAMELCHFGAKVVYPPTLTPAMELGIPIFVRNTFRPDFPGSKISKDPVINSRIITGISSIDSIALLRIQGGGMVGVPGVATRVFGSLARKNISVVLITQASSEHTICIAVDPTNASDAKSAIETEFASELQDGEIDPVIVEKDLSIISIVGEMMRNTPGVSARLFSSLAKNGINVVAIAQGSSELNISIVICKEHERKALNALHESFFLSETRTINIFVVGVGLIGKTLLSQIKEQQQRLKSDLLLDLKIIGLADSKRMLLNSEGVDLSRYKEELSDGQTKKKLADFINNIHDLNLPGSVFVDCTASDESVSHYTELLNSSISVVTSNKKAQSGKLSIYKQIKSTALKRGVQFLYETSVGAGLPVINTLSDLLGSGDQIIKIEAVLSGTLSYIFNSLVPGRSFSTIVKEAKTKGYTEPDPRDDLSGLDVARKLLILAREIGLDLELRDIIISKFLPDECFKAPSIEEFFKLLELQDAKFNEMAIECDRQSQKLCYSAQVTEGKAEIKLIQVDRSHPFYSLSGSDNMISYTSKRYRDRPLVVKGPGAGAEVTAAGVFADIIRTA